MRIRLICNRTKGWAKRLYPEAKEYLESDGHRITEGNCDATVVIGGDGTIIYHKKSIDGILVGIGSKRSGICQLNRGNWKQNLARMLKGEPEKVSMLKAVINGKEYSAINEIVVRNREFRAIHTTVSCGRKTLKFFGDGVLVCTRIGSTAYNRSLLGPVFRKDLMCVTPIAEIGKNRKSAVFKYCPMTIKILEKSCCVIDGNEILDIGKKMKIEKGDSIIYGK